jgi:hypothetical protein
LKFSQISFDASGQSSEGFLQIKFVIKMLLVILLSEDNALCPVKSTSISLQKFFK